MALLVDHFDIPAQGTRLDLSGRYFFVMNQQSLIDITVNRQNTAVGVAKGLSQGFRYGPAAEKFTSLDVKNANGNAQRIQLAIADDPVEYTALTGTVNVIDQSTGRAVALAQRAFIGFILHAPATGQYVAVQLWNPADSGRNVILKRIYTDDGETSSIDVGFSSAPIGSNYSRGFNKYSLGARSGAQLRGDVTAAEHGGSFAKVTGYLSFDNMEIVLAPGSGLTAGPSTTGQYMRAAFEWEEEAV
jgi:hypothetical protein